MAIQDYAQIARRKKMSSWILIIMLSSGAIDHIEFDTKEQCSKASIEVMANTSPYPVTVCVESKHD